MDRPNTHSGDEVLVEESQDALIIGVCTLLDLVVQLMMLPDGHWIF